MKAEGLTLRQEKLDELIYLSDNDPELKEALVWVDQQALKQGISMLDMCEMILTKITNRNSAKEWVKTLQRKNGKV